jgi:hypothetical protein
MSEAVAEVSSADVSLTLPLLVLSGFAPREVAALSAELGAGIEPVCAERPHDVVAWFERRGGLVLCLGPGLSGAEGCRFLAALASAMPLEELRIIVLVGGPDLHLFQDLLDQGRLYYLSAAQPSSHDEIALLLRSALAARRLASLVEDAAGTAPHVELDALLELAPLLARQSGIETGVALVAHRATELMGARARLWIPEPESDTLRAPRQAGRAEARVSAVVGLVSFVNRTGRVLRVERAGSDPRFDADVDGEGCSDRFLAVPVNAGPGGFAAVIALTRGSDCPPFTDREEEAAGRLAAVVAPILDLLAARDTHEGWLASNHGVMGSELADMFRPAALRRQIGGEVDPSPLPRLSGSGMRWAYRVFLVLLLGAALITVFGSLREYARGWAVVRMAAPTSGGPPGRLIALLPARYRPLVRPGMKLQLKLEGFNRSAQWLVIQKVAPAVVGPTEARRLLGPEIGDAAPVTGLVFLVEAPLLAATFHGSSGDYAYHDGMPGTAEVPVRSERILFDLFPALRSVIGSP